MLLTVCNNINMKNVIKFVKSVKASDVKSVKCTQIAFNVTLCNVYNDL